MRLDRARGRPGYRADAPVASHSAAGPFSGPKGSRPRGRAPLTPAIDHHKTSTTWSSRRKGRSRCPSKTSHRPWGARRRSSGSCRAGRHAPPSRLPAPAAGDACFRASIRLPPQPASAGSRLTTLSVHFRVSQVIKRLAPPATSAKGVAPFEHGRPGCREVPDPSGCRSATGRSSSRRGPSIPGLPSAGIKEFNQLVPRLMNRSIVE